MENPIITIETRTAPIGMLYVQKEFPHFVPVQIVQLKFYVAAIAVPLFFRALRRTHIIHHATDDLRWQAPRFR